MGQCKDCQWWDSPLTVYFSSEKTVTGWGECKLTEVEYTVKHPETLALIQARGDSGALATAPTFGCVQFEAKPDAR
jgi:hypothetical protein